MMLERVSAATVMAVSSVVGEASAEVVGRVKSSTAVQVAYTVGTGKASKPVNT